MPVSMPLKPLDPGMRREDGKGGNQSLPDKWPVDLYQQIT